MWNRLLKYIDSIGAPGEKKTPETNPSEPLPQKESELERSKRIFYEKLKIDNKETYEQLNLLKSVSEKFTIGEQVDYLKIPNDDVKFYVSEYKDFQLQLNYSGRLKIKPASVSVQYFDANQIIHTITDESKWFKKV